MGIVPRIRSSILAAKDKLAEGREKLRKQHAEGSPGIQVCSFLTDLWDSIVLELYETAMAEMDDVAREELRRQIVLVAHGGYGRRDVAPYSDVDLLLLHRPAARARVAQLARRLITDVGDVGLNLGFGVRTPAQAWRLARRDPVIFTSQAEARYLAGSERLFSAFTSRFRREARRRSRTLINLIDAERRKERAHYGETVYLLEPNVKRSRGALRDIHLVRWIGFARYGDVDPERLRMAGVLSAEDERRLKKAAGFLLRLRNELHFHSGKSDDVLYRAEQVRIATSWQYQGSDGVLPVEQFMRDYFDHTSTIRNIVGNILATARQRSTILLAISSLFGRQVEGDYRVGPIHISATRQGLAKLEGNLAEVLRLMDLSNQYNKRIEHRTWQAIRQDMMVRDHIEISEEAAGRFMSLLSQTPRLGDLLRRLHELRVLEKLVSGMERARCLLQFNKYHKYTVDEHCIRAVERATEFLGDSGPLGAVYRAIGQRAVVHLALLIHDLGKGYAEDHSSVGEALAVETAARLKLKDQDAEIVRFLVGKHLLMSHLAFRRDTSEEAPIVQFASEVGSPELLRMLFVLTCADLAAVGPGVLNRWKIEVLSELYHRTLEHLSGDPAADVNRRLEEIGRRVLAGAPKAHADWFARQIKAAPPAYLLGRPADRIVEDFEQLREIRPDQALASGRYLDDRRVLEFTVATVEAIVPGIFHRLTGALTSQGLQILSADIFTLADDLVLDRFYVHDNDYVGPPPQERIDRICKALVNSLKHPAEAPPLFRQTWHARDEQTERSLELLPTRVTVDNSTSRQYTVLDIFAHDRIGLLYTITRTLFELGINVRIAKIGTYLDQVVDVFYVTDQQGKKIDQEEKLKRIRGRLLDAIGQGASPTPLVRSGAASGHDG
jgi:[protein-PII] uridylyltransferase